jgi:hypothetical protein
MSYDRLSTLRARVVAFSGHLTDFNRAVARLPEGKVASLRRRIRERLGVHGHPVHGVCSAARGADLTFLEELVAGADTATVFLPFPAAAFKKASVGHGWDERFDAILGDPHVTVRPPLIDVAPPEGDWPQAFADCNTAILDEAERLSALFAERDPILLVVWDGAVPVATGGTGQVVEAGRARGHRVEIIDPATL